MKARALLPGFVLDHILHFEAEIRRAVVAFSSELPRGSRVLDAGAGEGQYASHFRDHRYTAVDLAVGDSCWDYSKLHCVADLEALPFLSRSFDGAVNIVTLEHVRRPQQVLCELSRVLKPGGRLLLITPHEWEEHQQPHDFYRYTKYGLRHLLGEAGFEIAELRPAGGFFRLLSRRLFNSLQFFPGPLKLLAAVAVAPAALLLPALDPLDSARNFTLGHICIARRR